ncbi:hypothetical protein D1J36_005215 [Riemerella anatipestifer]|uniref:hypothetical protein n=1 Tax=Riemerella anatipestifer TaxID=34085 RepID=UPI0012ADC8E2|nr:hypothetical protein [Riemerella anatipestifer]MDY3338253.1 hypothetical protein [Riemerella anatipestifer]USL94710.1 hypothetical protein D1J36_005215 [Riemerella anatipestifer]
MRNNIIFKSILFLIVLFSFSSCKYFSNKKDKNKELDKIVEQVINELKLEQLQDYKFLSSSIYHKTNIQQDTINLVLKNYFESFRGYKFNEKSKEFTHIKKFKKSKSYYTFTEDLISNYKLEAKSTYLIVNEILFFENIENKDIKSIKYDIEDIKQELEDLSKE